MQSQERRFKGIRKDDGKIIKGTLKEAPLKLKASSIPSKIQNIVYSNHHKAAFGNSQERFYILNNQKLHNNPGPGNYNLSTNESKISSKKGSGNFASETKLVRFNDKRNWNPGPGSYLQKVNRSKSSVYLSTQIQAHQLFKDEINIKKNLPGPGNYNQTLKKSASAATHMFNSLNKRFMKDISQNPPIGLYNWQFSKQRKAKSYKFSKADNNISQNGKTKQLDTLIGLKVNKQLEQLGPGKYNPKLLQTKKAFSIIQNSKNRFGQSRFQRQTNNLATYENITQPQQKNKASTSRSPNSIFKSKTRRYEFGQFQRKIIGDPGVYNPKLDSWRSHLINFSKKWI